MPTTAASPAMSPRLIMITGPIASGKSTIAAALATRIRNQGRSVALVDLDTVAEMCQRHDWDWAHEVHGELVSAWLATPVDVVLDEGTGSAAEVEAVLRSIKTDGSSFHVVLDADYQRCLELAQLDDTRGLSRDPEFLRRDHAAFSADRPHLRANVTIDVAHTTPLVHAEKIYQTAFC